VIQATGKRVSEKHIAFTGTSVWRQTWTSRRGVEPFERLIDLAEIQIDLWPQVAKAGRGLHGRRRVAHRRV
jgi:hypothetical protein